MQHADMPNYRTCILPCRVRYWQQAPWLSPQEAAAVSPATPDQPGIPAGPLAAQAASKPAQHIMEVGHPGDGTLTAVHMPALPGDAPAEADGRRQPSEDVLAVSMEDLLLRAAANNARVQLGKSSCPDLLLSFAVLAFASSVH